MCPFELRFKDKESKDLMWAAARSFLEDGYNDNMNQIYVTNAEAYQWLKQNLPELWCKFKMSDKPKCDMLSNNLSESFNNYIKEEREEPILSLLEMLRRQFMCRFQKEGTGLLSTMEHGKYCQVPTHFCQVYIITLAAIGVAIDCFIIHPPKDVRKVEVLKEEIVMLPPFKRLPERSIGHTDAGRGRGTTTDVVGGRKVAAGASRETKTAVDSAATGRGRGRGRGPLSGTGNWNGIDMSTMQHFIPATELPPR
ncbi:UNVERIFIED_CONTAM: hypothetical protein Sradi_6135200 [Sesamum radiatum]|uniref:Uncharacterized protein n=1 Tax=Sesamum radiatum TaxID=300843 RepID=A0AAW2KLI2_SESRA